MLARLLNGIVVAISVPVLSGPEDQQRLKRWVEANYKTKHASLTPACSESPDTKGDMYFTHFLDHGYTLWLQYQPVVPAHCSARSPKGAIHFYSLVFLMAADPGLSTAARKAAAAGGD